MMKMAIFRNELRRYRYLVIFTCQLLLLSCGGDDDVSVSVEKTWNASNPENTPIIIDTNVDATNQQVISDGQGGILVVWQDNRSGAWRIYAQRLDKFGNKIWDDVGVVLAQGGGAQENPNVIADGLGGAYVAWQGVAVAGGDANIYAQHIDNQGALLWPSDSSIIDNAAGDQIIPQLVSDASGLIVSWLDIADSSWYKLIAMKLDRDGNKLWSNAVVLSPGFVLSTTYTYIDSYHTTSDELGGMYVTWTGGIGLASPRDGLQHVNSQGELTLSKYVNPLNSSAYGSSLSLVSDHANGVFPLCTIVYNNGTANTPDLVTRIYAQRVNSLDQFLWPVNGNISGTLVAIQQTSPIVPAAYYYESKAISSKDKGIVIVWQLASNNLYAQKLDEYGNKVWPEQGVLVADSTTDISNISIISDEYGGAIITWQEGVDANADIKAQRIIAKGELLWGIDNLTVSSAKEKQRHPVVVSNGRGGAIIVWRDYRNGLVNADLYAQGISATGKL